MTEKQTAVEFLENQIRILKPSGFSDSSIILDNVPDPTILLVGVLAMLVGVLFLVFLLPLPILTRSKVFTKVEVFFGVVAREC